MREVEGPANQARLHAASTMVEEQLPRLALSEQVIERHRRRL